MRFTAREKQLLRLALDLAAPEGEALNAWTRLLPLLRKRKVSGYEIEGGPAAANLATYFSAIGRKGGRATKGSHAAFERAQKAAQARWKKRAN
jgi:hypothetical protein